MITKNEDELAMENLMEVQKRMFNIYLQSLKVLPLLSSLNEVPVKLTPNKVIHQEDGLKLIHYKSTAKRVHKTPLLIVYALINRHYILDVENKSAVKNLLDQGFDVYMIDWGTLANSRQKLTIDDCVNGYIDRCVDIVRNTSNQDRISLLGYCMGGTFSSIYTTLHKEKVKNLLTLAPPIDCSKDTTIFASIARFLDVDMIVDTLGNIPPSLQYLFFMMLKPFKHYMQRYSDVAKRINDKNLIDNFMILEKWLWDTPPIPGEVFRQWVKDIYQKNLLIENRLIIGKNVIDLNNIDIPLLNILAESDHLVSPQSSKALNNAVSSKDKTLMIFPTGHIGLCASTYSQKEVWPRVGQWLIDRS